ncbi:MAG: hypothetical protein H6741_04705 [Alphaproteobacteria bacterium]|nr:hypothetical protein [Alphaproteobacteria bacterium]MCB9792008.1 hypothetical protein [Alphaproteobacteria bacterium]
MPPEELTPRTLLILGGLLLLVFPAVFVLGGLATLPLARALAPGFADPLSAAMAAALSMAVCFGLLRRLTRE